LPACNAGHCSKEAKKNSQKNQKTQKPLKTYCAMRATAVKAAVCFGCKFEKKEKILREFQEFFPNGQNQSKKPVRSRKNQASALD